MVAENLSFARALVATNIKAAVALRGARLRGAFAGPSVAVAWSVGAAASVGRVGSVGAGDVVAEVATRRRLVRAVVSAGRVCSAASGVSFPSAPVGSLSSIRFVSVSAPGRAR